MDKLSYSDKLNIIGHNDNTLALWFRNTLSIITLNMLFLIIFKNKKFKYLFFILPILSLSFFIYIMFQYKIKHDVIYNNIEGDEMNKFYEVGVNNIYILVFLIIFLIIFLILYFFKFI
jgi:hypothetical protein